MSANADDATDNDVQICCSALLPTQVGIDQNGDMRKDFPFNLKTLSPKEKHTMSRSTLAPPKKQESVKPPSPVFAK